MSHNGNLSSAEAILAYRAGRLSLEEAQAKPDRLQEVRKTTLARVSWLAANGYPGLSQDLNAWLARAGENP